MNRPLTRSGQTQFLDGQLLIAMPGMGDPRFERAVIFLCAHSQDGAMGIRINQAVPRLTFTEVLSKLGILDEEGIRIPPPVEKVRVHSGGPVETGRGFVLHSNDYKSEKSTLLVNEDVCLTATIEILKAIVTGAGPKQALLALGYAGWGPGQLESEIKANGWLHCPAKPEVVFDPSLDDKYPRALALLGISPGSLSGVAGRA
jgi:putative transcriptional regulator